MYCKNCGVPVVEDSNFCAKCGKAIEESISVTTVKKENDCPLCYFFGPFKKYADFEGRSSRKEYWMFMLFCIIVMFILSSFEEINHMNEGFFVGLFELITFIPFLSLGIRRMHDVNRSGWFILVPIYNFILEIRKGTTGTNRFGADPYAVN